MSNDHPTDETDDADDEYWRRVHDTDAEDVRKPTGDDTAVKTDPDEVRGWAEERGAVPVTDLNATGPGAFALRHENAVDGSAHERVSWDDFAASFRDDDMAFHHTHEDDEAGTHRFVNRSDVEEHVDAEGIDDSNGGVAGTAEDEGRAHGRTDDTLTADDGRTDDTHAGEADPDIGAAETDRDDDTGTVVGDHEGGVDSGAHADTDAGRTETDAPTETDLLADVNEGDSVVDDQGESVGIVTAVEAGTIYVDPDPSLTEKLSAKLGWVDQDDAEYTVEADDVAAVENGDVRLKPVTL